MCILTQMCVVDLLLYVVIITEVIKTSLGIFRLFLENRPSKHSFPWLIVALHSTQFAKSI